MRTLKQLSATEAARRFSEVLDRVEQKGEPVVIVPAVPWQRSVRQAPGAGKALKEVLRAHGPDPDLADEVRELREFIGPAQDRWPD